MAIADSRIVLQRVQVDGRRYVTERHTDDRGKDYKITYLAGIADNLRQNLRRHATELEADLVELRQRQRRDNIEDREQAEELDGLTDRQLRRVMRLQPDEVADVRAALTRRKARAD